MWKLIDFAVKHYKTVILIVFCYFSEQEEPDSRSEPILVDVQNVRDNNSFRVSVCDDASSIIIEDRPLNISTFLIRILL